MTQLESKSMSKPDVVGADSPKSKSPKGAFSRRNFIAGASVALGAGIAGRLAWQATEGFQHSSVAIMKAESYNQTLAQTMLAGLRELGIGRADIRGRSVLLKPNLVEPSAAAPHINTHPAVVRAAIEAFRRLDAAEVIVAEGQGHCRDSQLVLEQSGFDEMVRETGVDFIDLNHDDVYEHENKFAATRLSSLFLPKTLRRADIIVSMPKMKTHHWAGVTLSMKNLFGVLPGVCYGWPKNVLHHAGITESILDINAAVKPHLAIVDGIIGMEGDGPIMGSPLHAGVLVMGSNLPAVDATTARLMDFDPKNIPALRRAGGRLGPIDARNITQAGETIDSLKQTFAILDHPVMTKFRKP